MSERRRTLVQQLVELEKNGTDCVTVAALARAAGISRSSLYKYYPDILALIVKKPNGRRDFASGDYDIKQDMLRGQLVKNKELVSCLSNICSNQLVEIAELSEHILHLERTSQAKIAYLQAELASMQKSPLRIV